jgi:hypothetical protein
MMRLALIGLAILTAVAVASPSRADDAQRGAQSKWAQETECSREAFKHFPDYTPESNANRENYRRACLRARGLPAESGRVAPQGN